MAFPHKFRSLIETEEDQVAIPDYVWLSFAVCATEEASCGWGGWIIESAWKAHAHGNDEKKVEVEVEADTEQRCPRCNRLLYRTDVEKQYQLNPDAGPKITFPHET